MRKHMQYEHTWELTSKETHQSWRQHYGRKEFEIHWFWSFYFQFEHHVSVKLQYNHSALVTEVHIWPCKAQDRTEMTQENTGTKDTQHITIYNLYSNIQYKYPTHK